ncbi:3-deoxy-D-manno-octulosonic acid transferase [Candidatus Nitrospira bockiana]
MWHLLYNVLLLLASPAILVILLAKQRCRRGLPQRLGFASAEPAGASRGPRSRAPLMWVHAVSLGEVVAAVPLVHALRSRYPEARLVVSTVTETGREAVEQRLGGVAEHRYAPLDFPWVVSGIVARLQPTLFVFVETELWPNLLRALRRRAVPTVLVNGRLSSRSFRGYRLLASFMRRVLDDVSLCLMQSDRDADRIIALGARAERVRRTGNIKFDQPMPQTGSLSRSVLITDQEELLVAGSTHPGEEDALLAAYRRLLETVPDLVLLLAPRHIERAPRVEALVKEHGFPVVRRSTISLNVTDRGPRVIVLDTRGELAAVYQYAVAAFVGGTLVPVGGHNLLEPASWGKAVVFGPYTDHCAEVARLLLEAGGGVRVASGADLGPRLAAMLADRSRLEQIGKAAHEVILRNQGALQRTIEAIENLLRPGQDVSPGRTDARSAAVDRRASAE